MHVARLHGVVHEPKAQSVASGRKGLANGPEAPLRAQRGHRTTELERNENRMPRVEARASRMGNACLLAPRLSAGMGTSAASTGTLGSRGELERELPRPAAPAQEARASTCHHLIRH